jgi:tetratricopeptide (TPR) repeat protein
MSKKDLKSLFGIVLFLSCVILGSGCGPDLVEKALEQGTAFEAKGQLSEALAEYSRAIELSPSNTNAYYNRALVYQKQSNSQAAFADFEKIISLNPNYSEPYYYRGQIYDGRGQRDKALADYTQAIENNINYAAAYSKRAMIYHAKGEYQKALDDAQKAKGMGVRVSEDFIRQLQASAAKQK